MQITRDVPTFRPVTIQLEHRGEYLMLLAILNSVACNLPPSPQVVREAVVYYERLSAAGAFNDT